MQENCLRCLAVFLPQNREGIKYGDPGGTPANRVDPRRLASVDERNAQLD